jgi:hypothetical protein
MSEETIPQMREQIDELTKQLKSERNTNTQLATENRVLAARDVFRERGYSPKAGELFAAANPEGDITVESVDTFAQEFGFGALDSGAENQEENADEGSEANEPAPGNPDLSLMGRSGSGVGEGGAGGSSSEPMTRQEWQELYARDPQTARAAVASGRVQISDDNFYVGKPTVGNPYASSTG